MKNKIPKIAIGTVQFGLNYGISNVEGKTNPEEVSNILKAAYREGIKLIDTAQAYGDSERVLGLLHKNRFQFISKINPKPNDLRSTKFFVQESLDKLNLDSLYGFLFHSARSALQNSRIVGELKGYQEKGIIQKLGFSVYSPDELKKLISVYGKPDIIQIPFNHLDQRFEEMAFDLHCKGVEIHTRSAFLQGLFFRNPDELPDFFKPISSYLKNLKQSFKNQSHLAQAMLNFCLSKDFIDFVVIGVNNEAQLISNIKILELEQNSDLPEPPRNISEKILMPNLWPKN